MITAECWSLGGLLALVTNIETSCSAMDLSKFGPNVGLLVCWSVAGSVLKKKGPEKRKEKKDQQDQQNTYIYTYIPYRDYVFGCWSATNIRPTFDQQTNTRRGHGKGPVAR